jgi:hypothetical protein
MEKRIADVFALHKWKAERGVYYTDRSTGKLREIDVYAAQVFERPRRVKGTGAPLVNLDIVCECKSLGGSNIIFSNGSVPEHCNNSMSYWIGNDIVKFVTMTAEAYGISDKKKLRNIYAYASERAYPRGGMALRSPVNIPPPPVSIIARAFRETKCGKISKDKVFGKNGISPLWNAIMSCLSTMDSLRNRTAENVMQWVHDDNSAFYDVNKSAEFASFFFDAGLMRNSFFHPFIVLNATLWNLAESQLDSVESARLYIADINGKCVYVDVVNEAYADTYIESMVSHYKSASKRSIAGVWRLIEEIDWSPGQAEQEFKKALGLETTINAK